MAQEVRKTVIVVGGNSAKNKLWVDRVARVYKNTYNVLPFYFSHWKSGDEDVDFQLELERLSSVANGLDDCIIIAKSAGVLLTLLGISRRRLTPSAFIALGLPLRYAEYRGCNVEQLCESVVGRCSAMVIQQDQDPQGTYETIKKILPLSVPAIRIDGDDHTYNNLGYIKRYIEAFVNLNTAFVPWRTEASSLIEAVREADAKRKVFKYYNCWLSDPKNRILSFVYNNQTYVIKRTSSANANREILKAKLLRDAVGELKIGNRIVSVRIPQLISIGPRRTYLLSHYFGEDLNQSHYLVKTVASTPLGRIASTLWQTMLDNGIVYGGFLPRNTIITKNHIYLIDFEDINKKSRVAAETNYRIGWSYFTDTSEGSVQRSSPIGDTYKSLYQKIARGMLPEDPYEVAYQAESPGSGFKIDDIICNLSAYITPETEMLMDILLYAEKKHEIPLGIASYLCGLSEKIRVMSLVARRAEVISTIREDINTMLRMILDNDLATEHTKLIIRSNASHLDLGR